MKKIALLILCALPLLFISCASTTGITSDTGVKRISADKQKDYSGNWNDNDIRIVCEELIDECIESSMIKRFVKKNNRLPCVKLGTIMNLSDEYIDTNIISNKFRNAIINSGEMIFVASDSEAYGLRNEQLSQADHAALGTEAQIGNEKAADFMLQGSIRTVVDQYDGTIQKTYYVDVQLFDIETTQIVWTSENSEIVKVIKRDKYRY